jgi:hypothetical protein
VSEVIRYHTTMHSIGRNTGIPVPAEVLDRLGAGKRPAVVVEVNGYGYSSTVGSMGGQSLIPFSSEHRAASGIGGGDELEVGLTVDRSPREVAVPEDLASALETAGLTATFAQLAPSHRKAHVTAVEGAKSAETRQRRIESAIAKLQA